MTEITSPTVEQVERAGVHAALGEPTRLAIAEELVLSDRTPSELAERFGLPSNLLAHHLNVLEDAGLIHRSPSHGDARRRYIRLDVAVSAGMLVVPPTPASSILFVCTHNAARSQLACALWRDRSEIPATSAGTAPADEVHPGAVAVASAHGLDLGDARPRSYADVEGTDLVVSVCDVARESLPSGTTRHLHWSVADPVEDGRTSAFEAAFREIAARVESLAGRVEGAPR